MKRQLRGIAVVHGMIYTAMLIIFLNDAGVLI